MRFLLSAAVVLAVFATLVASSANAASLSLTGSVGSAIASGNDGNVTYTGNSAFGDVTFIASPNRSDLTWSSGNGLGINCPSSVNGCSTDSAYQIDTPEVLTVRFEQSVFLTSVDISLLSTSGRYFLRVDETGSIMGNGFDINFDSDDANRDGELNVRVNRWVTAIRFVPDSGEHNDFALARLRIDEHRIAPAPGPGNPIPEPSSVLLMVVGAGIVALQVRKRI
ncbi:MAG: PEP-CTERM sorting domain-containing protein [Myxococcota bacterium]